MRTGCPPLVVTRAVLFLSAALVCRTAFADFTGRVVNVHDGDTLTVLVDRTQVRVRLVDIDAPELHTCGAYEANAEQVRRGLAWVFVRYAPKDSPLYDLQTKARFERRGLWNDARAVAPWQWRAAKARRAEI